MRQAVRHIRFDRLLADKGYDAEPNHVLCRQGLGIRSTVIPARQNSLTRMLQDSVTNRVLEITTVPVEVVTGGEISKLERYGIPAAIGVGLGLALLALG